MNKPFHMNIQLFAEPGVNFEEILKKHVGDDGNIPGDAITKAASAISSAVGRAFVDKTRYNAKLEEIETLKTEKQTAEDKLTAAEKWQEKYKTEHDAFEKFKADTDAKNRLSEIKTAYKKLLTDAGIDPKRHDTIIRATTFDSMKLDADGKLENSDDLKKSIESEWADFKVTNTTTGAKVDTPPTHGNPAKKTKEEIIAIKDTAERQRAIAENHEMFGF